MNHFDDLVAGVRELRPIGADDELPRSANAGVGPSQPNPHAALYRALLSAFPVPSDFERVLDLGMGIKRIVESRARCKFRESRAAGAGGVWLERALTAG